MTCRHLLAALCLLLAAGCSWVEVDTEAAAIEVLGRDADLSSCERLGVVTASVAHRVAFYTRKADTVAEELRRLARNEAVSMGADTLQPQAPPEDGRQRFVAFRCLA